MSRHVRTACSALQEYEALHGSEWCGRVASSAQEGRTMRALLTSSGIKNRSIHDALVELLGRPIAECNALFVPTAIYPFRGGPGMAWRAMSGRASSPLA